LTIELKIFSCHWTFALFEDLSSVNIMAILCLLDCTSVLFIHFQHLGQDVLTDTECYKAQSSLASLVNLLFCGWVNLRLRVFKGFTSHVVISYRLRIQTQCSFTTTSGIYVNPTSVSTHAVKKKKRYTLAGEVWRGHDSRHLLWVFLNLQKSETPDFHRELKLQGWVREGRQLWERNL
jgi:hypothetical protein